MSLAEQPTDLNMKSRSWAGFLSSLQNYYKTKQKWVLTIQEILPLKLPCKMEQEQNLYSMNTWNVYSMHKLQG